MLTRVDVQSENPFYLNIRDAKPTDSIIVQKIEGLGPPDVNLFMGDYARDGGSYNGRRVPPRSISITLQLNPNYRLGETVDGLRELLYKSFMDPFVTSDALALILHDDIKPDRFIEGFTDKFEPDIFSDNTTALISMRCPNPYIQDVVVTNHAVSGPTFPFTYEGSVEAGMIISADIITDTPILTLDLNGTKKMYFEYPFVADDQFILDTRRGSRRVQVIRTESMVTTTKDILYSKTDESTWIDLHSLNNILKAYGEDPSDIVADISNISFRGLHWGL